MIDYEKVTHEGCQIATEPLGLPYHFPSMLHGEEAKVKHRSESLIMLIFIVTGNMSLYDVVVESL